MSDDKIVNLFGKKPEVEEGPTETDVELTRRFLVDSAESLDSEEGFNGAIVILVRHEDGVVTDTCVGMSDNMLGDDIRLTGVLYHAAADIAMNGFSGVDL